ncbi:DNA topoisomerase IV subunit A [Abyssicoccus albus]|uniref:DNA topoisomerase 4 subunit A n=1 Tax=Abyssicoccus albus TaxID=1817405 RepID=A0A3N5CFG8_9BACL|nr:DNA topoisomerase IV subunit A [Abyssicoccus albus]RPF57945.1 DNA topoisomerase IV subunit A [Abyssicoccus albus]
MSNNVEHISLEDVLGDRFGRYSKYIIQDRALPDVRDGLKPVQRRILYAMHQEGNTADKPFRKSAKAVGNVIGNYHPHGDISVYDAMVRLGQDWKVRIPLVEMHGNKGSVDGDPPAAMRYTEARLSKVSSELLRDIEKETVEFVNNFDDTIMEPTVLPSRFPNIVVNGATGISAGYATNIPPHNLNEVIQAVIHMIDKPNITTDKLIQYIKGPDFPTGGIVQGLDGIRSAYETGKGKVVLRSKTEVESLRGNKSQIVIHEIPYEVNKSNLVKKIDEIRVDKKVDGIVEVRDESDRQGLRVVIEIKKDSDINGILNYLYKHTDLQVNYHYNMVAIHNRRPELMSMKDILNAYIRHQKEIIFKRSVYELSQKEKRMHIVEGLMKALSILDEVIELIRSSKDKKEAKQKLQKKYEFSEAQAEAIVTLQLYRLTNTDITLLQDEHKSLNMEIDRLNSIINHEEILKSVLKDELKAVNKSIKIDRQSIIEEEIEEIKISKEITIPKEDTIVSMTRDGFIKRTTKRSYSSTDDDAVDLKPGDYITHTIEANTQQNILLFTNKGHYIYIPVHELPDIKWKDIGTHISQIVQLKQNEFIIELLIVDNFKDSHLEIVLATQHGMIKRSTLESFNTTRKSRTIQCMNLKTDDTLQFVQKISTHSDNDQQYILSVSKHGFSLLYRIDELSVIGLKAAGVKNMNLHEDEIRSVEVVQLNDEILVATHRGAVKKMKVELLEVQKRALKGQRILKPLKLTPHYIVKVKRINDDLNHKKENDALNDEFIAQLINEDGEFFEISLNEIRYYDKYTNGTFIVDESDFGSIVNILIQEERV